MQQSVSKSMPVTPRYNTTNFIEDASASFLQHKQSHSQKLDSLLNELEVEYGLNNITNQNSKNQTKDKVHHDSKNCNDEADHEIDQKEMKLWEIAKSIKKHNASYRTAAKLLRELQSQQRKIQSIGWWALFK